MEKDLSIVVEVNAVVVVAAAAVIDLLDCWEFVPATKGLTSPRVSPLAELADANK